MTYASVGSRAPYIDWAWRLVEGSGRRNPQRLANIQHLLADLVRPLARRGKRCPSERAR
jgi:hypothetical protein